MKLWSYRLKAKCPSWEFKVYQKKIPRKYISLPSAHWWTTWRKPRSKWREKGQTQVITQVKIAGAVMNTAIKKRRTLNSFSNPEIFRHMSIWSFNLSQSVKRPLESKTVAEINSDSLTHVLLKFLKLKTFLKHLWPEAYSHASGNVFALLNLIYVLSNSSLSPFYTETIWTCTWLILRDKGL